MTSTMTLANDCQIPIDDTNHKAWTNYQHHLASNGIEAKSVSHLLSIGKRCDRAVDHQGSMTVYTPVQGMPLTVLLPHRLGRGCITIFPEFF
jgi:hypothetical protein